MSEREEVNEISFIREAFIEGRTYLYTQTGDLVCNIAELLREYDALRAQLTTAERELDEVRWERDKALADAQGVVNVLGFFSSCIKSGEQWTPQCDDMLHAAFAHRNKK